MPRPTTPGVFIEEVPASPGPIGGGPTSHTAFVDVFARGPIDTPVRVASYREFARHFGGIYEPSRAAYGIQQFFLNGGEAAWVVRVASAAARSATVDLGILTLEAADPGTWGDQLEATIAKPRSGSGDFDLMVRELAPANGTPRPAVLTEEALVNLSLDPAAPRYVGTVLAAESALVRLGGDVTPGRTAPGSRGGGADPSQRFAGGVDDAGVTATELIGGRDPQTGPSGIFSLDLIEPEAFSLLCLPAMAHPADPDPIAGWNQVFTAAAAYCEEQLAFFIVDPPDAWSGQPQALQIDRMVEFFDQNLSNRTDHAAVYFPRIAISDPPSEAPLETEASGTMAGVYATTDSRRGVWKAPAGTEATLAGARPVVELSDTDNARLNPVGINALRTFSVIGSVSWGARTLRGADLLGSQWKYVPVRRLALHIERSVRRGIRWAVFEPNDQELWSTLQESVAGFLTDLFRAGAFAGRSADESFFVRCDATTTLPRDIDRGVVNIVVGFAPLQPAEFIVLSFSQQAAAP